MRPAYARFPMTAVFHAIGLGLLMLIYATAQLPLYLCIPAYLLLGLWPWFGPWRQAPEAPAEEQASDPAEQLRAAAAQARERLQQSVQQLLVLTGELTRHLQPGNAYNPAVEPAQGTAALAAITATTRQLGLRVAAGEASLQRASNC